MKTIFTIGALAGMLVYAEAQVLANANATINLDYSQPYTGTTPMGVAWHPVFQQYYGGTGGNATFTGMVWNSTGGRVSTTTPINVDARAYTYNPNTASIEVVTFDAAFSGGVYTMGLDGSGNLTGTNALALGPLPGLNGSQTMPGYDPNLNVYYSRSQGADVNIVDRATGMLSSSFNLDVASAGNPSLQGYFLGYDELNNLLITVEDGADRAHVFTTTGAYLGASQLPGSPFNPTQSGFNAGYANGQLFVMDTLTSQMRGFQVVVPEPGTMVAVGVGIVLLALRRRR